MSKAEHNDGADKREIKIEVTETNDEAAPKQRGEPQSKKEIYEEKIAELEARLKDGDDKYLRLAAEFDNFRKRTARQFEEMSQAGRVRVITQLLDVLDNFQRALEAAAGSNNYGGLLDGMRLIYKNLYDILTREGLEPIEALGKPFDPNLHEAIMQMESDEYPEGSVVQEIVKGYKIGDKILRHSRVAVGKSPASGGKSDAEKSD